MTRCPNPALRVALARFSPELADGWALFAKVAVEDLSFLPLQDDVGNPLTTDYYHLSYLRERLAWDADTVLLAYVRGHHGPQYLGPESWVATYPDGDRRALSPEQVEAEWITAASGEPGGAT